MTVHEITSDDQFNSIIHSSKKGSYILIDFFATWCGPCKRIAPTIEKLSETFKNVTFLKVDVDNMQSLAEKYDIEAMPTFLLLRGGDVKTGDVKTSICNRITGADPTKIENLLKSISGKINPKNDF